jgi:hypothetical protein
MLGVAGERSATPRYANYTPGSPTAKSLIYRVVDEDEELGWRKVGDEGKR